LHMAYSTLIALMRRRRSTDFTRNGSVVTLDLAPASTI
jgi:hypothetical protein